MKTKLKVGQKVFDVFRQKWGNIYNIGFKGQYPIQVLFGNGLYTYTDTGLSHKDDEIPRLSLTEFNYATGTGKFTPIDLEPEPQIGDMVWGWNEKNSNTIYGKLQDEDKPNEWAYKIDTNWYKHISLTPPEWILETIKE
jgi:hypothetical protein